MNYACAIVDDGAVDGRVVCWGVNFQSQLGRGPGFGGDYASALDTVAGLDGIAARATRIATGAAFSCAALDTDEVRCWGSSQRGQLGNGGLTESDTPVTVSGLDGTNASVRALVAGDEHACVVLDTNEVHCWGANTNGRLGVGSMDYNVPTPMPVVDLDASDPRIVDIAAGDGFTCVLFETGDVHCWGDGFDCATGSDMTTTVPTPVDGATDIIALDAGEDHVCARTNGGDIVCWGRNEAAQLGRGGFDSYATPQRVPLPTGVEIALAQGDSDFGASIMTIGAPDRQAWCAVASNGRLWCWGHNFDGRLGLGVGELDLSYLGTPERVPVLLDVVDVDVGAANICALRSDGSATCAGATSSLGRPTPSGEPTLIHATVEGIDGVQARAIDISVGASHACVALDTGELRCWGQNDDGQLGDGTTDPSPDAPVTVVDFDGVARSAIAVVAGESHSCALEDTGAVWCWGDNFRSQLGVDPATTTSSATPVQVASLDGVANTVTKISGARRHACALTDDGRVLCWGDGSHLQLGGPNNVNTHVPVQVEEIDGVSRVATDVSAGFGHGCAQFDDGTAACWGINFSGQHADGTTSTNFQPVLGVDSSTPAREVVAGVADTCLVMADGELRCVGANGALGIGRVVTSCTPLPVLGWPQ